MHRIVHICWSPLVGHPLAIVNALNKFTNYSARFINLNIFKRGEFEKDLEWPIDKKEIYDVIEAADIIHFHQTIELENNVLDLNFKTMLGGSKKFVRQFSSEPWHFQKYGMKNYSYFADEKNVTHLVTGQYHERFYDALAVPLIVDPFICEQNYMEPDWRRPVLSFSPSNNFQIDESRWATKGRKEFIELVNELSKKYSFEFDLIEGEPHKEAIRRKEQSTIVSDELVTGTYHTSALEGLILGKPTFAFLDSHTTMLLSKMTGAVSLPFINTQLNQFASLFSELIFEPELCSSIGKASRNWFDEFYHPKKLVKHHEAIYEKILSGEDLVWPKKSANPGSKYLAIDQYDKLALPSET